eukprot:Amastigsp_a511734_8.p2 type:complete len:397 gc:universal Amastigsp_a511734_8:1736-546(-)
MAAATLNAALEAIRGASPFVASLHEKLISSRQAALVTPCEIVLGNDSADLDSIVSAIVCAIAVRGGDATPVVNIPREDFALRTETRWVFQALGVDVADALLFADECALASCARTVVLVDHNRMVPEQHIVLAERVSAIYDHHVDQGLYEAAAPRLIAPVGSCTTLLAELCADAARAAATAMDPGLAFLLLCVIVTDTCNSSAAAGKTTARDSAVMATLVDAISAVAPVDCAQLPTALWDAISAAKFNTDGFSAWNFVRRDSKFFRCDNTAAGRPIVVVIPAIYAPAGAWLALPDAGAALERLLTLHSIVLAMFVYTATDGSMRRELLLCGGDDSASLVNGLEAALLSSPYGIERAAQTAGAAGLPFGSRLFSQADVKATRKQIEPLAREFISGALA